MHHTILSRFHFCVDEHYTGPWPCGHLHIWTCISYCPFPTPWTISAAESLETYLYFDIYTKDKTDDFDFSFAFSVCYFPFAQHYTEPEYFTFKDPRDGILKLLRSPRIYSIRNHSARMCSLAGRYDNPIPTRFLAPNDCLKIPALDFVPSSCYHRLLADLR
jgi:hypothetical protein